MTTPADTRSLETLLPRLHRRARALVGCPEDAADLAQDAALQVWRHLGAGRPVENLEAYAMTTLRNLARSRWRRLIVFDPLDTDTATTEPEAPGRIACSELRAAVARLPEAQARLVRLIETGETSPAAIARITGVPVGTVMSRLARARARLRADLQIPEGKSAAILI